MLGFQVEDLGWGTFRGPTHVPDGLAPSTPPSRLPRETLAFREELDALKFLCKDLWAAMFQKHMDGLRTNHQVGV